MRGTRIQFFAMGCPEQVPYTLMDGLVFKEAWFCTSCSLSQSLLSFPLVFLHFPTSPFSALPSLVRSLQYCLQQIIFHAAHRPHHPLWQTTLVDERVHRLSVSVIFGISVFLQPSVELEVAPCSVFLRRRSRAEPESAQLRQVWYMDRTICPSWKLSMQFKAALVLNNVPEVLKIHLSRWNCLLYGFAAL